MELKKSNKADLEGKRLIFLELGFIVVLGIVLAAFEWTSRPSQSTELQISTEDVGDEEQIPITRQQQEIEPPPQTQVVVELNIVDNDVELDDQLELDDQTANDDMAMDIIAYTPSDDGEEVVEEVFIIVEDMPTFQGGDQNAFRTWIQQNLRYPEIAQENGISGKVYVQFAVNSRGEVVDVKVVRGVDPALDKEAVRVVSSSPKWVPGKQRGKPVKVQFTFPIVFVLQ
ncbi:MAG: TonB family protein [Bacteroidales bacterium]|nr:TonB family protein [Bacteroidales bacterium]MBN2762086.1 TonB family protein [Bacteroidales bacterium]